MVLATFSNITNEILVGRQAQVVITNQHVNLSRNSNDLTFLESNTKNI
jgi:hypothetical protein